MPKNARLSTRRPSGPHLLDIVLAGANLLENIS